MTWRVAWRESVFVAGRYQGDRGSWGSRARTADFDTEAEAREYAADLTEFAVPVVSEPLVYRIGGAA